MIAPVFEAETHHEVVAGSPVTWNSPAITDANFAIVCLHYERDGVNDITNPQCTFDGAAATYVDWVSRKIGNCWGVVTWYVANPGDTKEIVITFDDANAVNHPTGACRTYKAVDTADPIGVVAKATGNGTAISVTVASAVDETVIDMASQNTSGATQGAGQTMRVNHYVDAVRSMESDEAGAAPNVAMTWTTNEARHWATMGVSLKGYPAPTVTDCDPATGPTAGGTSVTLTGTEFRNGATVTFGGEDATAVVVVGPTEITCNTPAHDAGLVDIIVTNDDAQADTLENGFEYTAGGGKSHSRRQFLGLI